MSVLIKLFLIVSILFIPLSLSAGEIYSHQQANNILGQKKVIDSLQQFKNNKSANSQVESIYGWLNDESLEPLVKEKLLYDATLLLRQKTESSNYYQSMTDLLNYQSQALLPLEDAGRIKHVPVFKIAASAKATLIHWQMEAHYQQASTLLANQPESFLNQLATLDNQPEALKAYIKVIKHSDQTLLSSLADNIKLQQQSFPIEALNELTKLTADPELYQLLLNQYVDNNQTQSLVIRNLSQLPDAMTAADRIVVLKTAVEKPGLADAAIMAMAPFVDDYPGLQSFLNQRLADAKTGGAAAKSLSLSNDPLIISMLGENLQSNNPLTVRRSLLALYLNKSYQAKTILQGFHNSTRDEQLKQEIAQWLK